MSDSWVQYVANKLKPLGGNKSKIAQKTLNNKELVTKYVSAVDKTQVEINFLKLGTY